MSFGDWLRDTFGEEGLFSSGQEGHAFLIGISETIAFWKHRHDMPSDYQANGNPLQEWHYYAFGRACGVLVWIGLIALLKAVIL